jgi:hypothetical protein
MKRHTISQQYRSGYNYNSSKQQLDTCTEEQLQQIAEFVELLKLRAQTSDSPHDTPKAQVLEDFRQALHEAMTGQGIPIAQLWDKVAAALKKSRSEEQPRSCRYHHRLGNG